MDPGGSDDQRYADKILGFAFPTIVPMSWRRIRPPNWMIASVLVVLFSFKIGSKWVISDACSFVRNDDRTSASTGHFNRSAKEKTDSDKSCVEAPTTMTPCFCVERTSVQ